MRKKILYLLIPVFFMLLSCKAFAAIRICSGVDCYVYFAHYLSDEAWGDEVTDFTTDTEAVYCNVSATEEGSYTGPYELRWIKPNGEREYNLGTAITKVWKYQFGVMVGFHGWMVLDEIYREPGQWRVEHWAEGNLEEVGWGWHNLFTKYFTIPDRAFLSISPPTLVNLDAIETIDPGDCYAFGSIAFDGKYLWLAAQCSAPPPSYWVLKILKLDTSGNLIDSFVRNYSVSGLAFDGTFLWVSDSSEDKIIKIDTSGNIINSIDSPASNPQGLAFDGTHFWCAADGTHFIGYEIYKLDTSGDVIDFFRAPGGWPELRGTYGLTFDGKYLWSCAQSSLRGDKIYMFDTSGNIISSFDPPFSDPIGLAFDGTAMWHTAEGPNVIHRLESHFIAPVGEPRRQTFTVTSGGTLDLQIGTASITGPDASNFALEYDSCTGQMLESSETCTLDVSFLSGSQGGKIAYLEVPSNDSASPKLITLIANATIANICEGDFEPDGDVDGTDLAVFAADFGRTDCSGGCKGDFDGDGIVNRSDLAVFAADFGRTDCL